MKKRWMGMGILAVALTAGCDGNGESQAETETTTIEISVEKTAAQAPKQAAESANKNAQVHGGNALPPASQRGGALPAGHPPTAGQMPPGHPPIGSQGGARAGMPPGHPPFAKNRAAGGPMMNAPSAANDGHSVPLATGPHSPNADMLAGKKTIADSNLQEKFEEAFRKTFTQNRAMRDYDGAEGLLKDVLTTHPEHPQSLRTMGYVAVNQGFNFEKAMKYYLMSVKADDTYGPGHYALAFMYARGDREQGGKHYLRAMELGVPDARSIGKSFYPHLVQPASD